MRTLFFVVLFLFKGIVSHAQDNRSNEKVSTTEKCFALANKYSLAKPQQGTFFDCELKRTKKGKTATIYKYKNTKIKRALLFKTKQERPKLA